MSLLKRKGLEDNIQRRVRARREPSEELDSASSVAASENGGELTESSGESGSEAEEDGVCLPVTEVEH